MWQKYELFVTTSPGNLAVVPVLSYEFIQMNQIKS